MTAVSVLIEHRIAAMMDVKGSFKSKSCPNVHSLTIEDFPARKGAKISAVSAVSRLLQVPSKNINPDPYLKATEFATSAVCILLHYQGGYNRATSVLMIVFPYIAHWTTAVPLGIILIGYLVGVTMPDTLVRLFQLVAVGVLLCSGVPCIHVYVLTQSSGLLLAQGILSVSSAFLHIFDFAYTLYSSVPHSNQPLFKVNCPIYTFNCLKSED